MYFTKKIQSLFRTLSDIPSEKRKGLFFLCTSFFFTLGGYPLIRSTTTSLFMDAYGAKNTPVVWLYSIITLAIFMTVYNAIYKKYSTQKLFLFISVLSMLIFSFGSVFVKAIPLLSYVLFVWKEVYIVLLIHMTLGVFNASTDVKFAKAFYGVIGGAGSIGGILGGLLGNKLTYFLGSEEILMWSSLIIIFGIIFFHFTESLKTIDEPEEKTPKLGPIASIADVKKYVFYIIAIIALTQFVINLANFKFNILFDQVVPLKNEKTRFLTLMYATVNGVTLFVQIFIIPILFKFVRNSRIHFGIPLVYLVTAFIGFFLYGTFLMPLAAVFVIFKGLDYSIFSAAKEILYFPLTAIQRYGAKYIVDIVSYRAAKGFISFILILFYNDTFINVFLVVSMILWIVVLIPLFKEKEKVLQLTQGHKNECK